MKCDQVFGLHRAFSQITFHDKDDGLGLRSAKKHARAAFLASLLGTVDLQSRIWPELAQMDVTQEKDFRDAAVALDAELPNAIMSGIREGKIVKQKCMSKAIDNTELDRVLTDAHISVDRKAHYRLVSMPNADAFLHAFPDEAQGTKWDPELFRVAVKRRLRMPLFDGHGTCPACGSTMDRYGDHALHCMCGGDRTLRHNHLRNVVHRYAVAAGIPAEKEKIGLLPPNLPSEPAEGEPPDRGKRRPADVWLPHGLDGLPVAIDFAVTSGLRASCVGISAEDASPITASYEEAKRDYLGTEDLCRQQGLHFSPFVIEAHGGSMAAEARKVCGFLTQTAAAAEGAEPAHMAMKLIRSISTVLMRENARSVVRRMVPAADVSSAVGSAAWADEAV